MHRWILICALMSTLVATPAHAQEDSKEWYRATAGDMELGLSGNFGHLFTSELTNLNIQVNVGYFFTDSLEGGVAVSLGYLGTPTRTDGTKTGLRGIGKREQALASGPVASGSEWYGGTEAWLRFFPFIAFAEDLLPDVLAPFVNAEAGALYAKDVTPFFSASLSIGVNLYVTNQIAIAPEIGYGLVYASDSKRKFGDKSVEHVLAANFGLSLFITP